MLDFGSWCKSGDEEVDVFMTKVVKRMFYVIILAVAVIWLFGCASTTQEDVAIQREYFRAKAVQAQARNRRETQSLLDIECNGSCNFKKLKLANPFAKNDAVSINRPLTTREADSNTISNILPDIVDGVLIGAGIIGATKVLGKAFENSGGKNTNNNNYGTGTLTNTSTNTATEANNNVSSADGNSADTQDNDTTSISTSTTTSTTTSTDNTKTGTTTTGDVTQ